MFKNNRVQRQFKKEMKSIEKVAKRQEKKGVGLFSNQIFKLNFYGTNRVQEHKGKKALKDIFNFIAGAVTLIFVALGVMFLCMLFGWGI